MPRNPTHVPMAAVSVHDMDVWAREVAAIDREIIRLTERKVGVQKRMEAAKALFDLLEIDFTSAKQKPADGPPDEISEDSTFNDVIMYLVWAKAGPMSMADLRQGVLDSPIGDRLRESDKAYHHALSRAYGRGTVIRKDGWLFSPAAWEAYEKSLATGTAPELRPQIHQASPLGEAIRKIVSENPGIESGAVVKKLVGLPGMPNSIGRGETNNVAYNSISRMVSRKTLTKVGRQLYLAGQVPSDLLNGAQVPERETPGVGPGALIHEAKTGQSH